MKKIVILTAAFIAIAAKSQILTNSIPVPSITNSSVILDASTNYSAEAGESNNKHKGIVVPSVDLINFEFDLSQANGVTFRTYFDGMIVYNRSTGTTLTTGNRSSTATAVSPGYYYFYNPNGAVNGNVKGGEWRPMGITTEADTTNDAWVNDAANNIVKLGTRSDGTARTAGTDFVAKDNGSVGIGTNSPNNSALLDLTSTNKGVLVPRVALTSINDQVTIPAPAVGLMVYNTGAGALTYKGFVFWNGTEWRSISNETTANPSVAALNCSGATIFPLTFVSGVAYTGTLTVPYSGGNGGAYNTASFTQNGLTFTLNPGSLNYGNGTISYSVSGVPNFTSPTSIPVPISFLGTNCSVSIGQNSNFSNLIYVRKTVPINSSTPTTSITTIGSISVRYNGTGSKAVPQFRINGFSDRASAWMQKAGTGDNDSASFVLRDARANVWNDFSDNFNPGNRDSAVNYISLFGRNEIYRVSFVGYPSFPASGGFPAVTSSITIFIEKLE